MKSLLKMSHDDFLAFCRERGMKCTAQRLAVFSAIHASRHHPSVDEVWRKIRSSMPTVTRESVYRILNEFAAQGLVERLDALAAARYDTYTGPHAHFICEACGKIFDYPLPRNFTIPKGIRGEQHHLELRVSGLCEQCLQHRKSESK